MRARCAQLLKAATLFSCGARELVIQISFSQQLHTTCDHRRQLVQMPASAEFAAFIAAFGPTRIAPAAAKTFRNVEPKSPARA
jgi:hypothetical protein